MHLFLSIECPYVSYCDCPNSGAISDVSPNCGKLLRAADLRRLCPDRGLIAVGESQEISAIQGAHSQSQKKQINQTNKQTKYCVLNQVRQRQIAEAAAGQISAIHWSADNDTHGGEGDDNDCYGNKAPSTVKMTSQMQN